MSCDDNSFVTAVVEKSERYLAGEVAKVHKQINTIKGSHESDKVKIANLQLDNQELKKTVEDLKNTVEGLSNQVVKLTNEFTTLKESVENSRYTDPLYVMENAIRASLNVLMTASGSATGMPPVSGLDIAPLMAAVQSYGEPNATSTPKHRESTQPSTGETSQNIPHLDESPLLYKAKKASLSLGKRKILDAEAPWIYKTLENMPEHVRIKQRIEPFYDVDPMATNDKLNNVQRAFVKYKANDIFKTNASMTHGLINQFITEGVEEHIWTRNFSPSAPDLDLDQYLTNRLKNEKRSLMNKRKVSNTEQRISQYITQSLEEEH